MSSTLLSHPTRPALSIPPGPPGPAPVHCLHPQLPPSNSPRLDPSEHRTKQTCLELAKVMLKAGGVSPISCLRHLFPSGAPPWKYTHFYLTDTVGPGAADRGLAQAPLIEELGGEGCQKMTSPCWPWGTRTSDGMGGSSSLGSKWLLGTREV